MSAADVEALVDRVELAIEAAGGELAAERIGELCLEGLRELDRGAYLQFLGTLPSPNAGVCGVGRGGFRPGRARECIVTRSSGLRGAEASGERR